MTRYVNVLHVCDNNVNLCTPMFNIDTVIVQEATQD